MSKAVGPDGDRLRDLRAQARLLQQKQFKQKAVLVSVAKRALECADRHSDELSQMRSSLDISGSLAEGLAHPIEGFVKSRRAGAPSILEFAAGTRADNERTKRAGAGRAGQPARTPMLLLSEAIQKALQACDAHRAAAELRRLAAFGFRPVSVHALQDIEDAEVAVALAEQEARAAAAKAQAAAAASQAAEAQLEAAQEKEEEEEAGAAGSRGSSSFVKEAVAAGSRGSSSFVEEAVAAGRQTEAKGAKADGRADGRLDEGLFPSRTKSLTLSLVKPNAARQRPTRTTYRLIRVRVRLPPGAVLGATFAQDQRLPTIALDAAGARAVMSAAASPLGANHGANPLGIRARVMPDTARPGPERRHERRPGGGSGEMGEMRLRLAAGQLVLAVDEEGAAAQSASRLDGAVSGGAVSGTVLPADVLLQIDDEWLEGVHFDGGAISADALALAAAETMARLAPAPAERTITLLLARPATEPVGTLIETCTVTKEGRGPVGLLLQQASSQCVAIARVKPGTPAARSVPPLVAGMTLVSVDGDLMADANVAAERISSVGRGQMALEVMMPSTTRNWVSRLLRPEARRD